MANEDMIAYHTSLDLSEHLAQIAIRIGENFESAVMRMDKDMHFQFVVYAECFTEDRGVIRGNYMETPRDAFISLLEAINEEEKFGVPWWSPAYGNERLLDLLNKVPHKDKDDDRNDNGE